MAVNKIDAAYAEYEALMTERIYQAAETSLYTFIKASWSQFNSKPFVDNWHVGCLCEHLQAFLTGSTLGNGLVINIPPRHSKTAIATVGSTAWQYMRNPMWKVIHITHSANLYMENIDNIRKLITSKWYSDRWCDAINNPDHYKFSMSQTKNTGEWFKLEQGGEFFASTTRSSKVTGHGADIQILDDPSDANNSDIKALEQVNNFYRMVLPSRFDNQKTGKFLIIQQRLGQSDLSGYVLDRERESYYHLNIPMEFDRRKTFVSPIGFNDPRAEGELLDQERFDLDFVTKIKKNSGLDMYMCQYQQDPLPAAGVLVQVDTIQYYTQQPQYDILYCAWDMGLMGGTDNDYTVGVVVGKAAGRFYLVDMIREQADTMRQLQLVREIDNKYPGLAKHLVESGAGGDPIMSMLQREIGNFERLLPRQYGGSKENRVRATLPLYAESRVLLPELSPFVGTVLHELVGFPNAKTDDITDALTYALLWGVQYDGVGEVYVGLDKIYKGITINVDSQPVNDRLEAYSRKSARAIFT